MSYHIVRQYTVLVVTLATIVFNGLANVLPLNGQTTGEIPDRFSAFFAPVGYVFSIWSLIFLGLLAFAVYQLQPARRENPRVQRSGYLFTLSGVANMAWLGLWHYEYYVLTVFVMLALLLLLVAVYLRLGIGRERVPRAEFLLVHLPISIYLGWISVATIANITAALDYLQWSGWGLSPESWTIIMLTAGVAIAAAVSLTKGDVAFLLVIIWAFVGIAVKFPDARLGAVGAWVTTALVGVLLFVGAYLARQREPMLSSVG